MAAGDVLKNLEEKLNAVIKDFTTLTVRTFVGPVTGEWGHDDKFTVQGRATTKLMAMTEVSLDGDTDVLLPPKADGSIDRELLDLHHGTVAEAHAARTALVKAIVDVVTGGKK